MSDSEEMPNEQTTGEEDRLTTQWSVEDEEEAARERRRRERERQGQSQDDEGLTSPSVENGVSDVLDNRCDYSKPLGSSELEEDEGFSDWSLKLEQRKQRSGAQEAERLSAMSGAEAADGGQEQQGFGFKAFGGGFASLRINADCEFPPSNESAAQQDESPEEGIEDDGQAVVKPSLPPGLLHLTSEDDEANLEEDEALRGMGSMSREEESRDLERTIQQEAELEELKREARRRQQEEEEESRRREEEKYQQEREHHRQLEEYRRREEERQLEEQEHWRKQEEHRREQEEKMALEEVERRKMEEEELDRQRWEAAERRPKALSSSGSDGDESHRPLSPMSPTVKILERTESLNRSIQKSNSIKKTQPALPISKIDDRLEQYTHAIESSSKTPKLNRQPSIELISTVEAVSNKKNLFEAGDVSAQSGVKVPPCKDTEGLNVGVSDLINQFAKGSPNSKSSPPKSGGSGNKKYKFVLTGHGKYEKVFIDDNEAH